MKLPDFLSGIPGSTTATVAFKEIKIIMSQKLVLGLILLMLVVVVFTIGLAYSGKSGLAALENTNISVYISENVSQEDATNFRNLLEDTNVVKLKIYDSEEAIKQSILRRETKAGLIVHGRHSGSGRYIVDLIVDNSNPATSTFIFEVAKQAVQAVGYTTSRELLIEIWNNLSTIKSNLSGEIGRVDTFIEELQQSEVKLRDLNQSVNDVNIAEMRRILHEQGKRSTTIKNQLTTYTTDIKDFSTELSGIFGVIDDSKDKIEQYMSTAESARSNLVRYRDVLAGAVSILSEVKQSLGDSVPAATIAAINNAETQINDAKNQLDSSVQTLDTIQHDMSNTAVQLDDMKASLSKVDLKLSRSEQSITSLETQLDSTFVDLNALDDELSVFGTTVDEVKLLINDAMETKNIVDANLTESKRLMGSFVNSLGELQALSPEFLANPVIINKKAAFPEANTFTALVPALIAIVIMLTSILLSAVSFIVEKNQGAYLRMVLSTTSSKTLFAGKIIGQAIFATVEAILILAVGIAFFGVPILGSILELFIAIAIVSFAFISIGLFSTNFTRSQATTLLTGLVIMIPLIFLGGIVLPIELMNAVIGEIAQKLPLTLSISVLSEIMVKGNSLANLVLEMLLLIVPSLIFVLFTVLNRKID